MTKAIRSDFIQKLPQNNIPYKNAFGTWVWRRPDVPKDMRWPGFKSPKWVKSVIYKDGKWCWTDEVEYAS